MYSTNGHQLIVNAYHDECLRKARETEATRDAERMHASDGRTVAASAPDEAAPPILRPA